MATEKSGAKSFLKSLLTYRSALAGVIIILFMVSLSLYTVIAIPYPEAVRLWRLGEKSFMDNPRVAAPSWVNLFTSKKLPETIILDTRSSASGASKAIVSNTFRFEFTFSYDYDEFPSELNMFFFSKFNKTLHVAVYWQKPGGEPLKLKDFTLKAGEDAYYISADAVLIERLNKYLSEKVGAGLNQTLKAEEALFAVEDQSVLSRDTMQPAKGKYKVVVEGTAFEEGYSVDAKLVVYGKVHGIAGTDYHRRDLSIALLWGAPIALSFGVVAAVAVTCLQMVIAAVGAWYGGRADSLIQRATEFTMILPFLPVLMMISAFYKINIWVLLLVVIALSVLGYGTKTYRAMFLQIREFPYVEAAKAYGASNKRIIFRYLVPKVLPTIIPSLVLSVADFVFLEAALAILGLGDPDAPTWGKMINDAYGAGALYLGYYHWILEPALLLVVTTLGFALLGFALDKIFNPRLREV
ncbi:MAG: ABC transporter permease [Candidatus Nezhaarchaeota archaeon]|nr:ABC transporter permease [Candidatus Nezhaarchaeota archaeon]